MLYLYQLNYKIMKSLWKNLKMKIQFVVTSFKLLWQLKQSSKMFKFHTFEDLAKMQEQILKLQKPTTLEKARSQAKNLSQSSTTQKKTRRSKN